MNGRYRGGSVGPRLGAFSVFVLAMVFLGCAQAVPVGSDEQGDTDPDPPDLSSPVPIASVTDGVDGFDALDFAYGVATVTVDSSVYALVASDADNGVQIVDITNPASPEPTASVTDGSGGFDTLGGASGITAVSLGSSVYALVAASEFIAPTSEHGVQIIDITNPANPQPTASVTDGAGGFDVLANANGITSVTIGSRVYALVTSDSDHGVQVIDITDPASPQPTSSVSDEVGGFDALAGASGITTVALGSSTYALVAASLDAGVQIIDITNPANPQPTASVFDGTGGFEALGGATGIVTVSVGPTVYAVVAANSDNGVQIINITDPANPQATASLFDGSWGFDELEGASGIATVTVGSSVYVLVASDTDDGVQIIDITLPTPFAIRSVTDGFGGFETLEGAHGITTVTIGSSLYAIVASSFDDGIQIIGF